jgi:diguanylate cyclase (GGDEF)-like protein
MGGADKPRARALPPEWIATDRSQPVAVPSRAIAAQPALLVFDSSQVAAGRVLSPGQVTLGRGTRCDICLQDAAVSRRHCQLRIEPAAIWLKDLDSTNGSYVNGRRIEHRQLSYGDIIGVGGSTLRLVRDDSPEWRTQRSLADLASTDELTGLLNRRAFRLRIDAVPAQVPHALLMIDADHFKQINDRHGHAAGDRVIRQIGNSIRVLLPRDAFAGRVGGEEFAVVLSDTAQIEAVAWAETLREHIVNVPVALAAGSIGVSVSIGVACGRLPDDVRALFAQADNALYRAKAAGRNRVHA